MSKSAVRVQVPRVKRAYLILGAVSLLVALALIWSPLTSYFTERSQLANTRAQLAAAKSENATLRSEIAQLNDLRQIAYLAKTELYMVYPGQKGVVAKGG